MARHATPTHLKLLSGTPDHRDTNEREPDPVFTAPDPPDCLDADAAHHWRAIVPELCCTRLLTALDVPILTLLCRLLGQIDEAERHIAVEGRVLSVGEKGYQQISPWATIAKQNSDAVARLMRQLGMTPAARGGMKLEAPAADTSELDKI